MSIGSATPPRTSVRLAVLPDFSLLVGGRPVELRPASERLIGFLALQCGRAVPRGVASSTLWPDVPDTKANACLRSAIWRLARADVAVVDASATHVQLHRSVEVDLWAATARVTRLLDLASVGPYDVRLDRDLRHLEHDVLVGWFEDWALDEQERFRQLRLHALDRLGAMCLDAGRPADAVRVGHVAVSCEPLRESAQALLVRAHLAEGNVAEALRQFRSFAALLATELGIAPSRRLTRLVDDALVRAAAPSPVTRGRLASPAVRR